MAAVPQGLGGLERGVPRCQGRIGRQRVSGLQRGNGTRRNQSAIFAPDDKLRDEAVAQRMKEGGYLSEPDWIHRVLDQVYINLERVEAWGYPFRRDENGVPMRDHLQGPEYMKLMRSAVSRAGVRIMDQSPALELLADEHGVGGARGICRQKNKDWEVRAQSVVIATGGCAFLSKGLGCNVLTGEGLLMAAELGAELSGMEFSRQYAPSAAFGTVTRGGFSTGRRIMTKTGIRCTAPEAQAA